MKKHIVLISVGVLNVLHGSFHLIQFIQSMFFVAYATHEHDHNESFIEKVMHNPIFALIMGIIGIITLVIGIKDYRHHKKCQHKPKELSLKEQYEQANTKASELRRKLRESENDNENEFIYWM